MTQLFYIHSNVTYLAALSIIKLKKILNPILIFGRNYQCNYLENSFEKVYLDEVVDDLNSVPSTGDRLILFKKYRALKKFKVIIDNYCHDEFICYLPHVKNFLMQLFVMHKKCHEYNVLDEGMLSYTSINRIIKGTNEKYETNIFYKVVRFVKYFNHFNSSSYYFPIKAKFGYRYLFHLPNFCDDNTRKIDIPQINNNKQRDLTNSIVFIIDNLNSKAFLDNDKSKVALDRIFSDFPHKKIYIKFHPASKISKEVMELIGNYGIQFEVLDLDLPLELVFVKSKNIKVYGIFSSLLFYAAIFGHKSYSYINVAKEIDNNVSFILKQIMPEIFYEKVEIIQN